jgi:hypothetical protein
MAASSSQRLLAAESVHALEDAKALTVSQCSTPVQAHRVVSVAGDTTPADVAETYAVPPVEAGAILYSSDHFKVYPPGNAEPIGRFPTLAKAQAELLAWGDAARTIGAFVAWLANMLPHDAAHVGAGPSVAKSGLRVKPSSEVSRRRLGR